MKDNDEPIEGEIIEDAQPIPPDGVVVASNGAWRDATNGRFVPGGPAVSTAITKENAVDYLLLREQKKLEGLVAANEMLTTRAGTPGNGWQKIAGAMYSTALDKKSRVAAVQAARLLGEMTGYLGSGKDGGSGSAAGRASVTVDLDQDALMEFITSRRQQDTTKQDIIPAEQTQAGGSGVAAGAAGQTDGDGAEEE